MLQQLNEIRFEAKEERRKVLRDLCVSAYPDVQTWQVRMACISPKDPKDTREQCSKTLMEDLYYSYMSHLLNPMDGNEAARQDAELVKEYCEWSIGIKPRRAKNPLGLKNFMNIAARSSVLHKRYKRDLMVLLDLSLTVGIYDLALDLGKVVAFSLLFEVNCLATYRYSNISFSVLVDEILENEKLSSNNDALHHVSCCLRRIASVSLVDESSRMSKGKSDFESLQRVLKQIGRAHV